MLAFYVRGLIAAVLAGVIAGLVTRIVSGSVETGWVGAAVAVIFVVVLVWGFSRRLATTYTITNRRLTIDIGPAVTRDARDAARARAERQLAPASARAAPRVGTVDFDTAGGAAYDFKFRGVDDPRQIVRTVDRALHELRLTHPQV